MLKMKWGERDMELTHIDEKGSARIVDVGDKKNTKRQATAQATLIMKSETLALITSGGIPKGDVFSCGRVAGIMAAKKTYELIPMCHPIPIDGISLDIEVVEPDKLRIKATINCIHRTGIEMEALTAVSIAALTVYDMCKAVDKEMVISDVMLLEKSGGRSGNFIRKK
jgi:cyclic pyranopterin phosphate synthase